jgi:hypothetical protein
LVERISVGFADRSSPAFENFHLHPSIAATLERLGWSGNDPLVREAAPTVARGHNLVAVTPPSPAYATATLGAVFSREVGRLTLLLVPSTQLDEWRVLAHQLAHGTELKVHAARGAARVLRHLRAEAVDVLVTTPEIALTLVSRSALPLDTLSSFFLAWPEMLSDEELVTPLMQDLAKDAQRIIYTSEPARVDLLVERYARKALTVGPGEFDTQPGGPVRTVGVA